MTPASLIVCVKSKDTKESSKKADGRGQHWQTPGWYGTSEILISSVPAWSKAKWFSGLAKHVFITHHYWPLTLPVYVTNFCPFHPTKTDLIPALGTCRPGVSSDPQLKQSGSEHRSHFQVLSKNVETILSCNQARAQR